MNSFTHRTNSWQFSAIVVTEKECKCHNFFYNVNILTSKNEK